MLKQISATLKMCRNCGEVLWHPMKPLIGINTTLKESEIQYLISSTRFPVEFLWSHVQSPRLLAAAGEPGLRQMSMTTRLLNRTSDEFREADADGNGRVSPDEIASMIARRAVSTTT